MTKTTSNRTMTTQERRNQIAWQQFSQRLANADQQPGHHEHADHYKETFDIQEPSVRRSHSTGKRLQTLRQNTWKIVRNSQIEIPEQTIQPAPERVMKAKTRAERRAIDCVPDTVDTESISPKKRERRSPYWVERDAKRRGEARAFKTRDQLD